MTFPKTTPTLWWTTNAIVLDVITAPKLTVMAISYANTPIALIEHVLMLLAAAVTLSIASSALNAPKHTWDKQRGKQGTD